MDGLNTSKRDLRNEQINFSLNTSKLVQVKGMPQQHRVPCWVGRGRWHLETWVEVRYRRRSCRWLMLASECRHQSAAEPPTTSRAACVYCSSSELLLASLLRRRRPGWNSSVQQARTNTHTCTHTHAHTHRHTHANNDGNYRLCSEVRQLAATQTRSFPQQSSCQCQCVIRLIEASVSSFVQCFFHCWFNTNEWHHPCHSLLKQVETENPAPSSPTKWLLNWIWQQLTDPEDHNTYHVSPISTLMHAVLVSLLKIKILLKTVTVQRWHFSSGGQIHDHLLHQISSALCIKTGHLWAIQKKVDIFYGTRCKVHNHNSEKQV